MIDPVEFGKAMGALVRDAVDPLLARIDTLEGRQPERGERGDPGRDAEPVNIDAVVDAVVAKLLDSDRLATLFDLAVAKAVSDHFEANPVRDGRDGDRGPQGEKGEAGERGADGKDGIGLADALIDRDGALVLTMTDGRAKGLGVVVGRDGADGKDGRDGFDFEKCAGHFDAERGYVLTFSGGDASVEHVLPYMRHGGFWSDGRGAKAGESWTHDGALWIAKRDNGSKPCLENKEDWILAARKGRDGKDGTNGIDRTAPVKVG
jgi:hypothetical protein